MIQGKETTFLLGNSYQLVRILHNYLGASHLSSFWFYFLELHSNTQPEDSKNVGTILTQCSYKYSHRHWVLGYDQDTEGGHAFLDSHSCRLPGSMI